MAPSISVAEYYANKTLFITGATGFMGKVLIEKLLRSCPDIKQIYILIRSKKGQGCKERLDDYVNSRIFHKLQDEFPKRLDKLAAVAGDILAEDLGLSLEDRDVLQRDCQILFHCAACVRFDMPLRDAVNLNTAATGRVLALAAGMKNLESFLHVSTAYCRCELPVLEELVYPAVHRPQDVMAAVSWMDDDLINHMQPKIIDPQPNTYAYTKALTEDLVVQHAGKYPMAIARPSIVTAALNEPMPGWVDNMNGPTGLLVGAGKGVIRTMHCNENYLTDVIPVDMAVNACVIIAYLTGVEKPKEVKVYNVTQSAVNPLTWKRALDLGRVHVNEFPFSVCLWYPGGSYKSSRLHHLVALVLTHYLPAILVDFLLFMTGKKTFLIKVQKRVNYGLEVLQYYTTKQWHFKNENYLALKNSISEKDNETYYTDMTVINWSSYIRNYIKGAREFCCKEDPATLPQARKLNRQLYYLDKVTMVIIYSVCLYFLFYYVKLFLSFVN